MAYTKKGVADWNIDRGLVTSDEPGTIAIDGRKFASSKAFLIAAGPSTLGSGDQTGFDIKGEITSLSSKKGFTNLIPLGLVQQVGFAQQQQVFRIFEAGSRESYLIPGRENNRLTLNQVMYHGNNLLKALYLNSPHTANWTTNIKGGASARPAFDADQAMWWNLKSVIFETPIGIYLRMSSLDGDADGNKGNVQPNGDTNVMGGVYLEGCIIDSHNINVDANQVLIAENVSLQWTRTVPVA